VRRFGATPGPDGTHFRLWAPNVDRVDLVRPNLPVEAMRPAPDGFFALSVPDVGPGERYMFRVAGLDVPDPASRAQAEDADGWSVVEAPLAPGRATVVRPWHEAVLAEVHVGAASPEGTFAGLARRLDRFAAAGFTGLEIMPLADFVGRRNWGYDGVLPFAPDASYGPPAALRALVEEAHARQLAIVIDVVYNHFGPAGNFLHHYAEDFFAAEERTPWGPAIALDNPIVRDFFCENLRMWLAEYDVDGLRFDAVHAFRTAGVETFMQSLAARARAIKPDAFLILENDDNAARWLARDANGRPRHFTAQWNDDFHHVLYVAAGCDESGHYRDYGEDAVRHAARALAEGFAYQGEPSVQRGGRRRGEPSAHLPPDAFVDFVQNHDQIGNRPLGDRLAAVLAPEPFALFRFIMLLGPHIPLFFMGEEAGIDTPFPFFCDFHASLADAVREGRREEFKPFFDSYPGAGDDLPDPLSEEAFLAAKIPWERYDEPIHREHRLEFRRLAMLRRTLVWPLAASRYRGAELSRQGGVASISWRYDAGRLIMVFNMGATAGAIAAPALRPQATLGEVRLAQGRAFLRPWAAALWSSRS
jgi:malto-oligosyltrehalose trehalohydrolase